MDLCVCDNYNFFHFYTDCKSIIISLETLLMYRRMFKKSCPVREVLEFNRLNDPKAMKNKILLHFKILTSFHFAMLYVIAEENWWRGLRRDLRGTGPANQVQRGAEGGVGSAAQAGAQDGGGCAEEATG